MTWQGKRVLVTGADGFIGSHLVETLVRAGAEVRAFCLYNSSGSLGWLDESDRQVRESFDARLGDIRDARFVELACEGIEVVFHLAALIAIPYSYQAPESFVDTNVRGTLNVLEAVNRKGSERLVHTSTSEVYGTPDTVPITEDHRLRGQSPYSATKIAADMLVDSYHRSFGVPTVTLRPFNTYGPRQSTRAVIPTILAQLSHGLTTLRLGNLAPRRDFTFVSDTVAGFMAAGIASDLEGETIQLGTGRAESIGDVVDQAARIFGVKARVLTEDQRVRPMNSEVMILQSDPSKAHRLLDWSAVVSLEVGLERTASWIREHLHLFDTKTYSV